MATKDERRAAAERNLSDLHEHIAAAVESMQSPEGWKAWLNITAAFPQYSLNNQFALLQQSMARGVTPRAFASFNRWKEAGYPVQKGQQSFRILGPVMRKRPHDKDSGKILSDEEASKRPAKSIAWKRVPVAFKAVPTFEISQTAAAELTDIPEELTPERLTGLAPEGLLDRLAGYAADHGTTVEYQPLSSLGGANGYFQRRPAAQTHLIVIGADLDEAAQAKTLIHEIAHMRLHQDGGISRSTAEIEAESTAYVVAAQFGLDTSQYTFRYVGLWSNFDAEAVRQTAQRVTDVSAEITDAVRVVDDAEETAESSTAAVTLSARTEAVARHAEQAELHLDAALSANAAIADALTEAPTADADPHDQTPSVVDGLDTGIAGIEPHDLDWEQLQAAIMEAETESEINGDRRWDLFVPTPDAEIEGLKRENLARLWASSQTSSKQAAQQALDGDFVRRELSPYARASAGLEFISNLRHHDARHQGRRLTNADRQTLDEQEARLNRELADAAESSTEQARDLIAAHEQDLYLDLSEVPAAVIDRAWGMTEDGTDQTRRLYHERQARKPVAGPGIPHFNWTNARFVLEERARAKEGRTTTPEENSRNVEAIKEDIAWVAANPGGVDVPHLNRETLHAALAYWSAKPQAPAPGAAGQSPASRSRFAVEDLAAGENLDDAGAIARGDFIISKSDGAGPPILVTDHSGNRHHTAMISDIDKIRRLVDLWQANRDVIGRDHPLLSATDLRLDRLAESRESTDTAEVARRIRDARATRPGVIHSAGSSAPTIPESSSADLQRTSESETAGAPTPSNIPPSFREAMDGMHTALSNGQLTLDFSDDSPVRAAGIEDRQVDPEL